MRRRNGNSNPAILASALLLAAVIACGAEGETMSAGEIAETQQAADPPPSQMTEEPTPTPVAFPPAQNPLTGLPVEDPSLLDLPAVLVSISHFPVNARPQAGLSFAPWVFEIYITEGATRFLSVFYGGFPEPENTVNGDCPVRREPFQPTSNIIGSRVWLDENGNNTQDAWERGVGGVCVNLYDESGALLQQTTTDSNGYYGFNAAAGRYMVEFKKPAWMEFAQKNAGDAEKDSDADPASGRSEAVDVNSSLLHVDAGLILNSHPFPVSELPPAKVGPIRSGRLVYADIAAFFPDSCLIYAFASAEVLVELPQCFFVHHDIQGGGYMLEIEQLKRLAEERKGGKINYASNVFEPIPPEGGAAASRLHVFVAYLNQSAWVYDALSESYWRYVDNADMETAGYVHPEVDRLNNRQLQFENVIVLFTEHDVVSPTNLDIHLEANRSGRALLFRDGRMYEINWSTHVSDEELQSGRYKPIRFVSRDGSTLFPLKPGRTWILVVTPYTSVNERSADEWLLRFVQPAGAK
jgi:hypothetical protein